MAGLDETAYSSAVLRAELRIVYGRLADLAPKWAISAPCNFLFACNALLRRT